MRKRLASSGTDDQKTSSFLWRINRRTLRPQVSCEGSKRSVANGISISADHPSGVRRATARQTASHWTLKSRPSSVTRASVKAPLGFTSKK
jgi:hypothetical protein